MHIASVRHVCMFFRFLAHNAVSPSKIGRRDGWDVQVFTLYEW